MGFKLKVTKGKGEGKEFSFTKPNVTVGRQQGNDLVLYDLNVSREHFAIVSTDAGCVLRDLGSQNGTRVNQNPASDVALKDGDLIQAGAIEFEFSYSDTRPAIRLGGEAPGERAEIGAPANEAQRERLEEIQTAGVDVQAVRAEHAHALSERRRLHKPRAHLAGQQRHLGEISGQISGRLHAWWGGDAGRWPSWLKKLQRKGAAYPLLGALAFALLFGAFFASYRAKAPLDRSGEVFELTAAIDHRRYGEGRVDVATPRMAQFRFGYGGGRVFVAYTASGIERQNQVEILLNGFSLGFVPIASGDGGVPIEIKLDRKKLSKGNKNSLVFTRHAGPGKDGGWSVRDLVVREEPVPPEALAQAQVLLREAGEALARPGKHPHDLARAEQDYREAMRQVEDLDPPPPEYAAAEAGYHKATEALRAKLEDGVFRAERAENDGRTAEAEGVLRELLSCVPDENDVRRQALLSRIAKLRRNPP